MVGADLPQAFTLFDEARCRGADLQLRGDAVGLLTLGPTTTKDKLMQAAGRLRKLVRDFVCVAEPAVLQHWVASPS